MTRLEAMTILKRKARYAFQSEFTPTAQPEFATVFHPDDAEAILTEYSRTETVKDSLGVGVETIVYDTTSAAIACLEMIAPFVATGKSIGGLSVSYEDIQQAINRLKSSQFASINMGTAEE